MEVELETAAFAIANDSFFGWKLNIGWSVFILYRDLFFPGSVSLLQQLTLSPRPESLLHFLTCLLSVTKKKTQDLKGADWVSGKGPHQLNVCRCFLLDGLICQGDGQDLMFVLGTNQQMFNLWMCSIS